MNESHLGFHANEGIFSLTQLNIYQEGGRNSRERRVKINNKRGQGRKGKKRRWAQALPEEITSIAQLKSQHLIGPEWGSLLLTQAGRALM